MADLPPAVRVPAGDVLGGGALICGGVERTARRDGASSTARPPSRFRRAAGASRVRLPACGAAFAERCLITRRQQIPALVNAASGTADEAREALDVERRVRGARGRAGGHRATIRDLVGAGARRVLVAAATAPSRRQRPRCWTRTSELAILPGGTLNHFATDLGIPTEPAEALELAVVGTSAARRCRHGERAGLPQHEQRGRVRALRARRASASSGTSAIASPRSSRRCACSSSARLIAVEFEVDGKRAHLPHADRLHRRRRARAPAAHARQARAGWEAWPARDGRAAAARARACSPLRSTPSRAVWRPWRARPSWTASSSTLHASSPPSDDGRARRIDGSTESSRIVRLRDESPDATRHCDPRMRSRRALRGRDPPRRPMTSSRARSRAIVGERARARAARRAADLRVGRAAGYQKRPSLAVFPGTRDEVDRRRARARGDADVPFVRARRGHGTVGRRARRRRRAPRTPSSQARSSRSTPRMRARSSSRAW